MWPNISRHTHTHTHTTIYIYIYKIHLDRKDSVYRQVFPFIQIGRTHDLPEWDTKHSVYKLFNYTNPFKSKSNLVYSVIAYS